MGCPPSRASTQPTSAARLQAAPTTDRVDLHQRRIGPGGNLTGVTTLNTELAPKRRRNTIGRGNHGHLAANQICRHYRQSIVMPLSPGGSRQARCVLQQSQFHSDPGERRRPRCAYSQADPALRNPITGIAACCACAASGHAAAPPTAASNSRRPMVTVIRPSRARCVKGRIPRHECAVLADAAPGDGRGALRAPAPTEDRRPGQDSGLLSRVVCFALMASAVD